MVDGKRDARNRYFSLSVVTCAKQTNPTAVNPFVPLCDEGGRRGRWTLQYFRLAALSRGKLSKRSSSIRNKLVP